MSIVEPDRHSTRKFLTVRCTCGRDLRARVAMAGQEISCWECHRMVHVPVPHSAERAYWTIREGLQDVFEPRWLCVLFLFAAALVGVLSQTLLPRKPEGVIAAYEMMVVTPAIQNLIRENKVYRIESTIQTSKKDGMFLLDETLFNFWKRDVASKEDVLGKSSKPAELAARIMHAERGLLDEEFAGGGDDEHGLERQGTEQAGAPPRSEPAPAPGVGQYACGGACRRGAQNC